jgi:hypothetical protein
MKCIPRNVGNADYAIALQAPLLSLRGAQRRGNPVDLCGKMDCFAEPVIGRAFARPVGSQ